MSAAEAESIARAWIDAFNRHDVSALVALYAEGATHTSPKLRKQHPETGGLLVGHAALTRWWAEAFLRLPDLRYELLTLTAAPGRAFLEYLRHAPSEPPLPVAEAFDVAGGRITASRVYHG
jgi:ketosteroid isomerase-like protein